MKPWKHITGSNGDSKLGPSVSASLRLLPAIDFGLQQRAKALMLSARDIDASEALQLGSEFSKACS